MDLNFCPAGRDNFVDPDHRDRQDLPWFPDAALMDTVAHLQRDLNDMKAESRYLRTPGGSATPLLTSTRTVVQLVVEWRRL